MFTIFYNLWLLPKYAVTKSRLFFYCFLRAWLVWLLIILSAATAIAAVYPILHHWLVNDVLPFLLVKGISFNVYAAISDSLPEPTHFSFERQKTLQQSSYVILFLSYLVFAWQLPKLIERAEIKARLLLERSRVQKNIGLAVRSWRKGLSLLTQESKEDLLELFPKPSVEQRMRAEPGAAIDWESQQQSKESKREAKKESKKEKGFSLSSKKNKQKDKKPKEDNDKKKGQVEPDDALKTAILKPIKISDQMAAHEPLAVRNASQPDKLNNEALSSSAESVSDYSYSAEIDSSMLPCKIGQDQRYILQQELARGGMGIVFGGIDSTLNRPIAVKQLYSHLCGDPEQLERFKQEALLLAQLNHSNIVQIYDLVSQSQQVWIVMEWLKAGSLNDMITEAQLPVKTSLKLIVEVASALDLTHRHNIIHRDIKPMNILMTQSGSAKLTDFGTAKFSQSGFETQEGLAIGSPAYMSPEQAAGKEVDARSDIYSLGVTCYQLIVGEPPFKGDTISMMSQHITQVAIAPIVCSPNISEALSSVVMKMMEKKPDDRFQTMSEVIEALSVLSY